MNASTWISRGVSRLRTPSAKTPGTSAPAATEPTAHKPDRAPLPPRTLTERLAATLRRHGEAMAPRALRRALSDLQAVVGARVSEVEAGRRACEVMRWYAELDAAERRDVWLLISERFAPDAKKLSSARARHEASGA